MSNKKYSSQLLPSRKKTLAIAISALLGSAPSANAQQVLEEVIVTATKRAANLQDIPQSITAFTTDDIEKRGFFDLDDYAKHVPSLSFGRGEPGRTSLVFRGVAASGFQFGASPSASLYLDEQPITVAGANPDPRLIDIERLEALSGPQGTLFGDASQSGTLRIITNKPDASEFDSWIEASGSKVEDGDAGYDVSAMVNFPVIEDTLAVRLVGFRAEEAGFIDNVLGASPRGTFDNAANVEEDVNTSTTTGGRIGLRWTPNPDWTIDVSAIYQEVDVDGFGDVDLDQGDLQQLRFNDENYEDEWYQIALTMEGDLGFADGLLSLGYFNRDTVYNADATAYHQAFQTKGNDKFDADYNAFFGTTSDFYFYDFSPLYSGTGAAGDPRAYAHEEAGEERWTIEARLTTPVDSDSKWAGLVGVFYNRRDYQETFNSGNDAFEGSKAFYYIAGQAYFGQVNPLYLNPHSDPFNVTYYETLIPNPDLVPGVASLNGLPPGSWGPTNNWFFGLYDSTLEQFAIFGEMSFDFTENFTITAGGRWFRVEQKRRLIQGALMQGTKPDLTTDFVTLDQTSGSVEHGFVPKVNLTYRIQDDKMIYFTYSQGFRRGGGNAVKPNSILPRTYDSDKLTNFEFGAKTEWLDGTLRLNATAYMMRWDDIQIQVNDPQPTFFSLGFVNFPQAKIDGFELDFQWLPADGWNISGNLGYREAKLSEAAVLFPAGSINRFTSVIPTPPDNFPLQDTITAAEGARLPLSPDVNWSLAVEYSFQQELFGAQPYVRFDYAHRGESLNSLEGIQSGVFANPLRDQDDYDTVDIKVGLESQLWSASFFIDNVTDARGENFFNDRWIKTRLSINQPRTFGLRIRKRFK